MTSLRTATMAMALILAAPIAGGIVFDCTHPEDAREIRRNAYARRESGELGFFRSEAEAYQAAFERYP